MPFRVQGATPRGHPQRHRFRSWKTLSKDIWRSKIRLVIEKLIKLKYIIDIFCGAPLGVPLEGYLWEQTLRTWWALSNDTLRSIIGLELEKLFKFIK